MTIDKIVVAINQELEKIFSEVTIYNEAIKQGFKAPCFFVAILNTSTEKGLCKTYTDNIFFDVQYFSDLEDSNSDFMIVQNKLLRSIEYIQLEDGKVIRLNNRKVEKVNDILHYFFDVDVGLIEIEEGIKMEALEKEGVVKDE
ncbi:phage tail terminator family protein [Alkaliphilus sp. B6464]|uniref:phage tail terminator family protein n=1 Tax=Alkaliphilus sp. B6464 TaxID=2731219 RepID=UPI001BA94043|nr:hypothetical protein [Alkaliphilus sp. B6464]QUH21423.1 hypothetical protein HYG84_17060 [Alkaliphilus sp. B6464]